MVNIAYNFMKVNHERMANDISWFFISTVEFKKKKITII